MLQSPKVMRKMLETEHPCMCTRPTPWLQLCGFSRSMDTLQPHMIRYWSCNSNCDHLSIRLTQLQFRFLLLCSLTEYKICDDPWGNEGFPVAWGSSQRRTSLFWRESQQRVSSMLMAQKSFLWTTGKLHFTKIQGCTRCVQFACVAAAVFTFFELV